MGLKQRIAALGTKRIVITCVVGGVLCLPVTFALLMLLSVAWNECDIGGDPAARFSLVVVSWPLFLIHTAVFATVFMLLAGSSRSTFRIVGAGLGRAAHRDPPRRDPLRLDGRIDGPLHPGLPLQRPDLVAGVDSDLSQGLGGA